MIKILLYSFILTYQTGLLQASVLIKKLNKIKINSLTYKGSGCPKNSVFIDISPDKKVFTTSYNQFVVAKNGSSDPSGQKKSCLLSLSFNKPRSLGFSLFSLDIVGAGDLEENLIAKQKISIQALERPYKDPKREIKIIGPYSDDYERTEEFELRKNNWLSCYKKKARLKIKTQVSITPYLGRKNNKSGYMTVDQVEGLFKEKIGLVWVNCDKKQRKNPYLSFCKIKIFNEKKKKTVRVRILRARGMTEKDSYKKVKKKVQRICESLDKKKNLSCLTKEIVCKTHKLFNIR